MLKQTMLGGVHIVTGILVQVPTLFDLTIEVLVELVIRHEVLKTYFCSNCYNDVCELYMWYIFSSWNVNCFHEGLTINECSQGGLNPHIVSIAI